MAGVSNWLATSTRRRLLVGVCVLVAVIGSELGIVAAVRAVRPDHLSGAAQAEQAGWDDFPAENRATGSEVILSTGSFSTGALYSPAGPCFFPGPYFAEGVTVGCEPLERLFRRNANAVTVRAYLSPEQSQQGSFCGPEGACPPPECFPSRYLTAGLSTDAAVGSAYGPVYAEPAAPIVGTTGVFGAAEGDPVAWAVVQVGSEIATVRADFAAGGDDEMAPADGVVVLASPVEVDERDVPDVSGTLEARDGNGDVVASTDLRGLPGEERILSRPECAPRPPELPEPDGPPPENEAEARQAVIDAFTRVYTGDDPGGQSEGFADVDDPTGIAEAVEVVRQSFPGALTGTNTVRVDDVRFLNPTTAAVRYTILLPDYSIPEFPNRVGRAVLVDGSWKVTRDTICHDLALGGATC
jgi:hypothetical protein